MLVAHLDVRLERVSSILPHGHRDGVEQSECLLPGQGVVFEEGGDLKRRREEETVKKEEYFSKEGKTVREEEGQGKNKKAEENSKAEVDIQ